MEKIEKEFDKIQTLFNNGKKYLLGANKNIKLAIESYDNYLNELNNCYETLKKSQQDNDSLNQINKVYITHLAKLSKIFLMIPYYYKAKMLCEKIIELDPDNIDILPSYVKCLNHFGDYSHIKEILNNVKEENDKIKELKKNNEERIKESKGEYNLKDIYLKFKEDKNYNLDLAEYKSEKISIQKDKIKGLIVVSNDEIPKGELIIASRAITYVPKLDKNLEKIYYENEEHHFKLLKQIEEKMIYTKEDNPEIYELYDKENGNLSLEERHQNYINNLNKKNLTISEKKLKGIFTNTFQTQLYLYDEFALAFGLFYYPSFLSHSCVPNTQMLGIGDFMFMFTNRLIKKNEELFTYYVENDEEYNKRQKKLKNQYGFECQCELCQIEKKKFKDNPNLKNKISNYINELIEISSGFDFNIFQSKKDEVLNFIKKNKNNINNYEKGLLYFNLYFLNYGDYSINYNMLEKALECYEQEKDMEFNIMKYYCLLKMYKINYVFYEYRCEEVEKKMLKLIEETLGNKHNEYAEILLEDILELYTSDDDEDISNFQDFKNGGNEGCRNY